MTMVDNSQQGAVARILSNYAFVPDKKVVFLIYHESLKFRCKITKKYPVEPVYMADGSIVEKKEAENYIADAKRNGKPLRSLNSSKFMSKTLKPAEDVDMKIREIGQNLEFVVSLEKEALNDDINAMTKLASLYRGGKYGLPKDIHEYRTWMIKAHKKKAELGDTTTMTKLGKWYLSGGGPFNVTKDLEVSYHWYIMAAEAGNIVGLCNASKCLLHGWGVEKNETHGISLLVSAAGGGLDEACLRLGYYYLYGRYGLLANKALAKRWLQKVVDGKCRYRILNRKEDVIAAAKKAMRIFGI